MKEVLVIAAFLGLLCVAKTVEAESGEAPVIKKVSVSLNRTSPGRKVLVLCEVAHPQGAGEIKQVGASSIVGRWVTEYPHLYDDGTHGDRTSDDQTYSIEIEAPSKPGEAKVSCWVEDKQRHEVESQPVVLVVE